jgi:DNA-binding NarL/FixJ family response regulator
VVASPVKILCVDDSSDITELVSRAIGSHGDMRCVGCLSDSSCLLAEADRTSADIILLDLKMPGRDALSLINEIARTRPGCRVVVYSGFDDDACIRSVSDAGAWGYVSKAQDIDQTLDVVRRVAGGTRCFPARLGA